MSTIYIDADALLGPGIPGAAPWRGLVEAARACRNLRDLGHRVVLLGRPVPGGEPGDRPTEPPPDARGWLVSSDPDRCVRARRERRLRTMLVGPATPGQVDVERPADVVARDLSAAVMAIMTAEAMPTPS